nr:tetratricopeptide repeat protein [Xanthomonas massiliensis]
MDVRNGRAAWRPLFALVALAMLAGCASTPRKAPPPPYDGLMSRAEADLTSGQVTQALETFNDAAKADPTRKEPWVRMAQLQFDRGEYARAIVAAEEVLQRDPDDLVADGVLTVAGFRIAEQSLQRLQGRGALASDTARREAEQLAATLRKTMGDAVIAPPKPAPAKRKATPPRRAPTAEDGKPAAPAPASSDPFKNLGK